MLISKKSTLDLLPQKTPFVLVDQLMDYGTDFCTSIFKIPQEHVLIENNAVSSGLIIENIAQTAALHLGYTYHLSDKQPPIGFIAEIKDLHIIELPKIDDQIKTEIKIMHEVFNCLIVSGEILHDGHIIAYCTLKVFLNTTNA